MSDEHVHAKRSSGDGLGPAGSVLPWTYELPPEGDGSEWLEGYRVESPTGERLGSVLVALRHGRENYLVVRGGGIVHRRLPVVPWANVDFVDHGKALVRLSLTADMLGSGPVLSPDLGVHRKGAEAVRITRGAGLERIGTSTDNGTAARRSFLAAGLGALSFLTFLAVVALASGTHWRGGEFALFALPAVLFLAAVAGGFGVLAPGRNAVKERRPASRA